jgi:putative oxidoreductase
VKALMMTKKLYLTWVFRIVIAVVFALSAGQKFTSDPQYISEFAKVGFGDWFRYLTAVLEAIGVLVVLYSRTTPWGAAMLLMVTVGAWIAQVTVLNGAWYHCAIIGSGLLVLIWLTRSSPLYAQIKEPSEG